MSDASNLPVPAPVGPAALTPQQRWENEIADAFEGVGFYKTNLPDKTVPESQLILRALNGTTLSLDQANGKTLLLTGVIVAPQDVDGEVEGEVVRLIKTILVCKDGVNYHTWGKTARQCIARIMRSAAYGSGPWPEGLPVSVALEKVAGNRQVYRIFPAQMKEKKSG